MRLLQNRRWPYVAPCLASVLLAGCTARDAKSWTPRTQVRWHDLLTESAEWSCNGFRLLTPESTTGLFPTTIGVTRVAIEDADGDRFSRAVLLQDPRNEFLQWNSTLDDQFAVSEVFPIAKRDLGGGEAIPAQMVAAMRALRAGLGLIYAVNELSEHEVEMFGAIYDTQSARPLATIHAQAVSMVSPAERDEDDPTPDPWETDARALVRERFGTLVHACIRQMIRQDRPAQVEAPEGWTPAGPTRLAEWPPRYFDGQP